MLARKQKLRFRHTVDGRLSGSDGQTGYAFVVDDDVSNTPATVRAVAQKPAVCWQSAAPVVCGSAVATRWYAVPSRARLNGNGRRLAGKNHERWSADVSGALPPRLGLKRLAISPPPCNGGF